MTVPPVSRDAAIDRLNMLVREYEDQIEYYKSLELKEQCYRCHIKEVEFPRRVEKVTQQARVNVIKEVLSLVDDRNASIVRSHFKELV